MEAHEFSKALRDEALRAPARERSAPSGRETPVTTDRAIPIAIVRQADVRRRRRPQLAEQGAVAAGVVPRERLEWVNRVVNVLIASLALVLVAPVMLVVAIAVKLSSPGPVLYTQTRVGIDRRQRRTFAVVDRRGDDAGGIIFTIYKFRTMCVDAECSSGPVWATPNDPRATAVGALLRRTRLDELPQLLNVLKGDMNIVGPRPERPSIFTRLRSDIAEYPYRQRTKPGITGLAQISLPYDASIEDVRRKVQYDLEYLQRQGLAEDVRIMLRTVPVVLFRRGGW
ncbi:MAG TPA: sugar transferase [Gemmatimonadaceae bacterium]|nr:sugar transferase [Gemmatimonadaceae bacterium]